MPGFLAPVAIGVGSQLVGRILGGKKKKPADMYGLDDRIRSGLGSSGAAEDAYMSELGGYDPEADFSAKTNADLDAYDEDFARQFSSKVGNLYGHGRGLNVSGFGVRDAQDTIVEGQRQRARIRQQNADQLAARRMQLLGMKGQAVTGRANRFWDAATGRQNTMEAQRQADAASKRGMWGSLLGAGAQVLGAYAGARRGVPDFDWG